MSNLTEMLKTIGRGRLIKVTVTNDMNATRQIRHKQ